MHPDILACVQLNCWYSYDCMVYKGMNRWELKKEIQMDVRTYIYILFIKQTILFPQSHDFDWQYGHFLEPNSLQTNKASWLAPRSFFCEEAKPFTGVVFVEGGAWRFEEASSSSVAWASWYSWYIWYRANGFDYELHISSEYLQAVRLLGEFPAPWP